MLNTAVGAAHSGSVRCLRYLWVEVNPSLFDHQTLWAAAHCGHLRAIKFLCETRNFPFRDDVNICYMACMARTRALDCLEYLVPHGYYIGEKTTASAAGSGGLECLKYLLDVGCDFNHETSQNAARAGKVPCLTYSIDHGVPWWIGPFYVTDVRCLLFIERNAPSGVKCMINSACHPIYDQIIKQRSVMLMCLSRHGIPSHITHSIVIQAGLYCDIEIHNTNVSGTTSCSSFGMNDLTSSSFVSLLHG